MENATKTILHVESRLLVVRVVKSALKSDFEVHFACALEEADELLRTNHFDLLIVGNWVVGDDSVAWAEKLAKKQNVLILGDNSYTGRLPFYSRANLDDIDSFRDKVHERFPQAQA